MEKWIGKKYFTQHRIIKSSDFFPQRIFNLSHKFLIHPFFLGNYIRPVNLHPLSLFWKHGSVCDPVKKVQNMGCKMQGAKNRVIVVQKEKRPGCFFSFWITMTLFLHPAFCNPYFGPFFKVPDPKKISGRPDKLE